MNWHTPTLSDLAIFHQCALNNDFFANNYGAVNSILYERKFNSLIAIEGDWLFEKFFDNGKAFFSFPHNLHGSLKEINSAIALLSESAKSTGGELAFSNITLEEKDILLEFFPSAKVVAMPESADYIYRTENLSTLTGKKLSRKRNHIHQFEKQYEDFTFEPLTVQNFLAVREVEEKWFKENTSQAVEAGNFSDLEIEKEIIFYALDNFETFSKNCGMTGGLLFVSGIPVAFCIASLLSQKVTDIHFEKCLSSYARDGGYAVINNEFAKTVKTEFINREEDLGIEGLRKAKLSYYPERVLEKFSLVFS